MSSGKKPGKVSIIVVNWNGEAYLEQCLASLSQQSCANNEIILVDNGSSDHSLHLVRKNFPKIKLVELAYNSGFTGGNSAGLSVAQGEFIALVNNDTKAERDWLEKLLEPMVDEPTIGICASKLVIDGTDRIDSAGDGATTAGVGFNRGFRVSRREYSSFEPVFAACAAAALYRREMINDIGFLDEDFFLYDEDVDLSFRAQLAGWKCMYVPDAIVYHKGNATSVRLSDTHVYHHTRNVEFVWIKNMPTGLMVRFAHHKIIQEVGSFCYLCLRHMKWRAFFRAKRDALKMLPVMLGKRKRIQRRRRVSNHHIRRLLTSYFSSAIIRQKILQFFRG
jgi:GT2 family glycosyltransferase